MRPSRPQSRHFPKLRNEYSRRWAGVRLPRFARLRSITTSSASSIRSHRRPAFRTQRSSPRAVRSERRTIPRSFAQHGIQCVLAKNSGGSAAYAKIEAARQLGLKVSHGPSSHDRSATDRRHRRRSYGLDRAASFASRRTRRVDPRSTIVSFDFARRLRADQDQRAHIARPCLLHRRASSRRSTRLCGRRRAQKRRRFPARGQALRTSNALPI